MRWRYPDTQDDAENARREDIIQKIDGWWVDFAESAPQILGRFKNENEFDVPSFMQERLQAIDPNLMWEYGPASRGRGHRLVITPEHRHCLRPLVSEVMRRAPKMDGWQFFPARIPESAEMAQTTVVARTGRKSICKGVDIRINRHSQIDLEYIFPTIGFSEQAAFEEAFVLTETLLGEETLNVWIGEIKARSALVGSGRVKLEGLYQVVQSEITRLLNRLPDVPRWKLPKDSLTYGVVDLRKRAQEQSDDVSRSDLITFTAETLVGADLIAGPLFFSQRYSKHGEIFCFIQIDNSEQALPHSIETRSAIEDALDNALIEKGYGCVVGSGYGLKRLSIELALTDVLRSIPIIRDILQSFGAPKKTWLFFHDVDLGAEWCGVWPDSPKPVGLSTGAEVEVASNPFSH